MDDVSLDAGRSGAQPLIHVGALLGGQQRVPPARRRAMSRDRSGSGERLGTMRGGRQRHSGISPVFAPTDPATPSLPHRPPRRFPSPTAPPARPRACSTSAPVPPKDRGFSPAPVLDVDLFRRQRSRSGSCQPLGAPRTAVAQLSGFYLVKFAVSATACYLTIQLLITFAEVLLPFIFAVLCCIVLEPLKKFIMRIFQRLAVLLFRKLHWNFCFESYPYPGPRGPTDTGYRSDGELAYGGLPEDSAGEDVAVAAAAMSPLEAPVPTIKRLILAISILVCILLSCRVLWLTVKVFVRAGYSISQDLEFYRQGAERMKQWFQTLVVDLHFEASDAAKLLDGIVKEVENIGTIVTQNVLYTVVQAVVTFIFLIYMLWSPIRMESSTMTREVFKSTSRYLKVKCLISAVTGLSVAVILWVLELDLPAAFGLLACLANFLPGIGSILATLFPCLLAAIDVRKTPTQVLLAIVLQFGMHFVIDFVIEPVFFGISVEIHSVIVILGIYFFYQVWGVPGMMLSVPILAVVRIMMRSMRQANKAGASGTEDSDTIVFLDNILEGRWMSSVGERGLEEELELAEVSAWDTRREALEDEGQNSPPPPSAGGATPPPIGPTDSGADHLLHAQADLWALDLWALVCDSPIARDILQFYEANRLCVDCALLVLIMGMIFFIPL